MYDNTLRMRPYRKKDPIFFKEHQAESKALTKRKMSAMLTSLKSQVRKTFKAPSLDSMLAKRVAIARHFADETPEDEVQVRHLREILKRSQQKYHISLRPPRRLLKEQERLAQEERLLQRRALGILGRKPLPPELPLEQEELVERTLMKSGKIAHMPGAGVESHDIRKLEPGQWLNDEVINFYMKLIEKRSSEAFQRRNQAREARKRLEHNSYTDGIPDHAVIDGTRLTDIALVRAAKKKWNGIWNVHVFNSFFYEKLSKGGYSGVRQWTRKVDIFTKDKVLIPINVGQMHWTCAAINLRDCRFEYYDSMHTRNPRVFTYLADYLAAEYKDKKKEEYGPLDLSGWTRYFSRQCPAQSNGFDCGVFATMTIEQLSRRNPLDGPLLDELSAEKVLKHSMELAQTGCADDGESESEDESSATEEEWNFSQQNMPYLRRRMIYEIVSTALLEE